MKVLAVFFVVGALLPCCVRTAHAGTAPFTSSYAKDAEGVTINTVQGKIRIEICSPEIVHVIASPNQNIPKQKVPIVIHHWPLVPFSIREKGSSIWIETARVRVQVDRHDGVVGFFNLDGSPILQESKDEGRKFVPKVISGVPAWQVEQSFVSPRDEALYGLGQHQEGWFNLREIPFRLQQANTNISIPFLLSTRGYGLLWNNASVTDYDSAEIPVSIDPSTGRGTFSVSQPGDYGFVLGSDETKQLKLTVDGKTIIDLRSMWMPDTASGHLEIDRVGEHRVEAQGGAKGVSLSLRRPSSLTTFRSMAGNAVDYYFFYGPRLDSVLAEYREATGEAPLFPKWAYGFWQCRERYSSQKQLLDAAREFRSRHIPVDVFVQDWRYWGKYGWNAMRFDEATYPDPVAMTKELHQENIHLMISVWPKFGTDTRVYQQMKANDVLIEGETPAHERWLDSFNPKGQDLFWKDMEKGLLEKGVDGWWLDASEPEFHPLNEKSTFLGPSAFIANAYPLYETTAVYQGQRATTNDKRVVILTRSAFAGQQRNAAASWSGDITSNWQTLRRQIPAGLNFGMSGMPYWATDTGGFFRPKDQYTSSAYHELLIRWFEFGVFCPLFRIHGFQSETEMWKFGPQVERILRNYDDLRYRMMPYIYSEAWEVTSKGQTMMRALPLEFPSDPKVRDIGNQFLFGPSLLINPVTEPGVEHRSVYLPAGTAWFDFWTGRRYDGGQTVEADAPIEKIPVYARAGSILAMGPVTSSTAEPQDPIDLRVYPGMDSTFDLYEDAGDGYQYENGQYSLIPMRWNEKEHTLSIGKQKGSFPGMRKHHTFRVIWAGGGIEPDQQSAQIVQYSGAAVQVREPKSILQSTRP